MDAESWDRRYAGTDLVWGLPPNHSVEAELADLAPGRALDLACGEGRNALWLAGRGWHVTGLDFSAVATERGRRLAAEARVADLVDFQVVDLLTDPWPTGPFDAVVVAYLQLPAADRRPVLRHAAAVLAPGGVLLVVAHDSANLADGVGGPQDPAVLYTATDVLTDLEGTSLVVEKAETVRRPVDGADRDALDVLARLRRPDA